MDEAFDKAQSSEEESSRGHSKEYAQTITYSLGDPDPKDKFVIQVLGNGIFGTPLFYTIGGASCCPAEPGTNSREAGVVIEDIVPRCGGSSLGTFGVPYVDECTDLKPGQAAIFDVVINTQYRNCINKRSYGSYIACDTKFGDDTFDFVLHLDNAFSSCGDQGLGVCPRQGGNDGTCDGDPGGMAITVDGVSMGHGDVDLGPVPLGRSRIVVSIVNGPLCGVYKNIKLTISSACEKAGSGGLCIMDQIPNEETAAGIPKTKFEAWKDDPEAVVMCNPPGIWDQVMSGVIRSSFVIPKFSWNLESDDEDSQRRRTASAPAATIEAMEALTTQVTEQVTKQVIEAMQEQQKSQLQLQEQRLQLQEQQRLQLQDQQRLQLQEQMWSTRIFLLAVVIAMGISFSQILLRKHEPSQQQHVGGKAGQQASGCGTIQLPAALL